jgi:ribosomal-protein-alanine N-acetyltransferase
MSDDRHRIVIKEFFPFPTLYTERLVLRRLTENDWPSVYLIRNDESINRYIGRNKHSTKEDVLKFIEQINTNILTGSSVYWAVCKKNESDLIGTICLWNFSEDQKTAELGYELLPAHQKMGFMREAVSKVIHYGLHDLGLLSIHANSHKDNRRSTRLLEQFGFREIKDKSDQDFPGSIFFELAASDIT